MAIFNSVVVLTTGVFILYQVPLGIQQTTYPIHLGVGCKENDFCTNSIKNSECSTVLLCSCATGYVPHPTNNTVCLTAAKHINDSCEEPIQCEDFGENAECRDNKCTCKPNHHDVIPNQCILSRGLNENCTDSSDCYLINDGIEQRIECDSQTKQCRCSKDYTPTSDALSCRNNREENEISWKKQKSLESNISDGQLEHQPNSLSEGQLKEDNGQRTVAGSGAARVISLTWFTSLLVLKVVALK